MTLSPLLLRLEAEQLDISYDDLLWCIACFTSEDPGAHLRDAPETLMLDTLARVAWWMGVDMDIRFVPGEA